MVVSNVQDGVGGANAEEGAMGDSVGTGANEEAVVANGDVLDVAEADVNGDADAEGAANEFMEDDLNQDPVAALVDVGAPPTVDVGASPTVDVGAPPNVDVGAPPGLDTVGPPTVDVGAPPNGDPEDAKGDGIDIVVSV